LQRIGSSRSEHTGQKLMGWSTERCRSQESTRTAPWFPSTCVVGSTARRL